MKLFGVSLFVLTVAFVSNAYAMPTALEADEFIYDQVQEIITAKGGVQLAQGAQTITANEMTYNVRDDVAVASGDIVFTDEDGNQYFADVIELNDQMRSGLIENLYSELEDGGRIWAKSAVRENPQNHALKDARYTPCLPCKTNPDATPPWALRASEVNHDKENALISYKNVRFEAGGVPVMYAPYFSHPDGTVDQKSGFLAPEIGFGSDFGFNFMTPYYWALSPSSDITAGLRIFTGAAPQLNLEGRKRFENGEIRLTTSSTYSERTDSVDGVDVFRDEEFRGHIELETLFDLNKYWRAGTDLQLATDEQYLDQYDIDDDDILENRAYVEGFDDRNYATLQLLGWQDLRIDSDTDQPNALPLANLSYVAKPNSSLGGRLKWDSSFLSLVRTGDDQDVNRLSSRLGWQRRDVLPLGLTSQVDFAVRGDAYYTLDRDIAKIDTTEDDKKFDTRAIPTANVEIAYPLHRPLENSQIRIKPRVSFTARPDVDNDSDIPNEDSVDTQINFTNLFDADRFAGVDRVEDRTRVNYGIETGYYKDNGDEFTAALGQSYRFDNDDNPFNQGSGFENQQSDVVGQLGLSLNKHRDNLNYRFQLDGKKLAVERHELYGATKIGKAKTSAIYLYEKGSQGTEFPESRQQIQGRVEYDINEKWTASAAALYDLGEDDGLRESIIGLGYDDECYGITAEIRRDLQSEASGSNDTTVLMRFRLKNLGEFETTAYDTGDNGDDDDEDNNGL